MLGEQPNPQHTNRPQPSTLIGGSTCRVTQRKFHSATDCCATRESPVSRRRYAPQPASSAWRPAHSFSHAMPSLSRSFPELALYSWVLSLNLVTGLVPLLYGRERRAVQPHAGNRRLAQCSFRRPLPGRCLLLRRGSGWRPGFCADLRRSTEMVQSHTAMSPRPLAYLTFVTLPRVKKGIQPDAHSPTR